MEASQYQKPTVGGSVFFLIDIGHVGRSLPYFFCFMFDGCKDKRSGPADYVKKIRKLNGNEEFVFRLQERKG
jgi:hypothetical protein